jgi:BRO1-like domain
VHHPYTVTDVTFELASVLYNIGALHSILGSMDSRTSAEVHINFSLL